ncbi:fimbrial biogenesis outer membrane usher protein [Escherichia coli]|nr:fimbrial biogenesis outer membrane usher protein [Escherichia coli]
MTAIRAAFKAYRMHQVLIMPRFARLTIALGLATAVFPVDAEYYFNPRFLSNDLAESVDLSAFTKGREAPPGTYRVDIYLNDEFMTSRDITFIADDNNAELIPCLSTDLLVSLGIKKSALLDNKEHSAEKHVPDNSACTPLQDRLADASTEFDVGQQHLSLSVPQIYVGRMARGYVSPDLWEEGINAGLLNYSFNGNSINNRSNHNAGKSNYAYLNLQSGINIGSWRLRDNSTWSYNSGSSNSSDSNKWQHINTSAERDIIPLRSRLTVGDSYTDGDIFDSVNFRGLKINSTEAMLPDSQHGFAPVIHGIARGTAQVSVKQNGYDVYQTTVPPGPFTIDDINSAANGGDLQVTIKEADGSIQTLYVPYSSVPVLQRAGYTRYALAMGEYRSGNNLQSSPKFIQVPFSHWMRTDSQSAFRNSNASYSMSNDLKGGMTNLSGVYGTLLPDNNLNYSVQVGNTHGGNTSSGTSGYSSLNYRGAYGNTNVGYSRNGDSSQIYYGMSGGIIAHADGITFGQPLGDTMVLVKAPGADNVKIENQTGIHTDWRGYAILPFATEYRENRVALNANSLADNVELDETVVTVIPTHGAIARATFNAQIGGKVLMTLKYGNKSVPFGAIVTHGENKNGSIVAENGQVYLTGLPQSGKLQVSWGNDKNSNCIVDYKLPEVSPGTLLNQQTAICR